MATQKIHIIDTEAESYDGLVQTPTKENIGIAWQNDAPTGHFITVQLENHWIVTDEDYKLLRKIKNAKNTN
jgi:hypothetical protein